MNTTELVVTIVLVLLWTLRWFLTNRETSKRLIILFSMWLLMGTVCFTLNAITGMPFVTFVLTGYHNLDGVLTWLISIGVVVIPAIILVIAFRIRGWDEYLDTLGEAVSLGGFVQFIFEVILIGALVKICSLIFSWLFAK